MILAQISDLHIAEPGQLVCGRVDTRAFLERCVARIRALPTRPDAVVITGDLVDRGTVREYQALRELLAPLTMPVYPLLGNHDDRAAFRQVFGDAPYLRNAREHVQYAFNVGELRVIALDTHDPGQPGGRLCAARLDWLAGELDAVRRQPVVIAMHHPPFATGIPFMDASGLAPDDAAELAAILSEHSNVERILCGHLHRSIQAWFAGTIAMTAPSCAHQVVLGFEPDTLSGFNFEPPGFLQHLWVDSMLVTHHTLIDPFPGPFSF